MADYVLSPEALDDLDAIWLYIALDNPEAADRVVESVHLVCRKLAVHPELGPVRRFPDNKPPDVRCFPLTEFPAYLIFYRTSSKNVEIIRVLHGAQDIEGLFGSL